MKKVLAVALLFTFSKPLFAQNWAVAFPITDYVIDDNDSVKIVQVRLPAGSTLIAQKQFGLLKGIYRNGNSDTAEIGSGRCQLIKGDYYYFGIRCNKKNCNPKKGDLIYTVLKRPNIYDGLIPKIAAHAINLQDVYEKDIYDRWDAINLWTKQLEDEKLAALIADIKFTAAEMRKQTPGIDKKIEKGPYKDKMVLDVMEQIQLTDLTNFLEYIIARPRLYAGNNWKASETFATWAYEGAPTVVK